MLQLILMIVVWLAYIAVSIPLWAIGVFVTLYLALSYKTVSRKSQYFDKTIVTWAPKWAWLWGNELDGVSPADYLPGKPAWLRAWLWSGWRNSVGNLQYVPGFRFVADPMRMHFLGTATLDPQVPIAPGTSAWALTWQGIRGSFLWMRRLNKPVLGKTLLQVWIGHKLLPRDVKGIDPKDPRSVSVPFATDVKAW